MQPSARLSVRCCWFGVSGKRVRPGAMLAAIWSGFLLSLIFHLLPDAPGDFLERVMPFVASLGIALTEG